MSLPAATLRLATKARARFDALTPGPALPEPHANWMAQLAEDRAKRDGLPK